MVDQGPEVALFSSGYDPGIFLNCSQSTPVQFGSLQNTTTGGAAIFQHTSEEQKYQQHWSDSQMKSIDLAARSLTGPRRSLTEVTMTVETESCYWIVTGHVSQFHFGFVDCDNGCLG